MFIILTVVDEDFLNVEHVFAVMTVLGVIIAICRSVIPDEVISLSNELGGNCTITVLLFLTFSKINL